MAKQKTAAAPTLELAAKFVPIAVIDPSPLPSQVRRRARFEESKLDELADSIKRHGVVNPITIRPSGERFELVAGERRFLATQKAGLAVIPAIVKDLDDGAAAEIQLIENGQRVDQHPLDEAFDYVDMETVLGFDHNEIALRVGKSPAYVLNRLKLTKVAEVVRQKFEDGLLSLGHALEIAKYPVDMHAAIVKEAIGYGDALMPLPALRNMITFRFMRPLKKAPFSPKATDLIPSGLSCNNCPERTKAQAELFADDQTPDDNCLNGSCWDKKLKAHIDKEIDEIAAAYHDGDKSAVIQIAVGGYSTKKNVMQSWNYTVIDKDNKCDKYVHAVVADGDGIGTTAKICCNVDCSVHGKNGQRASQELTPEQKEQRLIQEESAFNTRVASKVGNAVIASIFQKFETISFRDIESVDMSLVMAECLWSNGYHERDIVRDLLNLSKEQLGHDAPGEHLGLERLSVEERWKVCFIFLTSDFVCSEYRYEDQSTIRALAEEFGIDYAALDAAERLAQAPEEHAETLKAYQAAVQAGERPAIPSIYSDKWERPD